MKQTQTVKIKSARGGAHSTGKIASANTNKTGKGGSRVIRKG